MKTGFAHIVFASVFILASSDGAAQQVSSGQSISGPTPLSQEPSQTPSQAPQPTPFKLRAAYLPNAIQIDNKVISGGQPDGEQAFRELKELGVKTIVSVDGAKPDVAMAKKYGLRYVHLPHAYDGISQERSAELAKSVRELEGPIYIHCHHGKHRSPAAAAVACISAGRIEPHTALGILKLAGTNENYRGLFAAVSNATRIDEAKLDAMQIDFPEIAKLTPMAEAMVELEHTHDHLKQFAAVGWATLPKHPDLDPAHEALLMREHFREMLRLESIAKKPDGFLQYLKESESDSQSLEKELRNWRGSTNISAGPKSIDAIFNRINTHCTACHRSYRD